MKRKLLFLMALLASTIMAWADIVPSVDNDATYSPTTIVNGDFSTQPWMDYVYNNTTYNINSSNKPGRDNVVTSIPNGVGEGWNTTEKTIAYAGSTLFEWTSNMYTYNRTMTAAANSGHGAFIEMNANNAAVFSQDLRTYGNDVIRWTLQHAARTTAGPEIQAMEVEIGAPNRDGENIVAASGIGDAVNAQIQESTKAVYLATGCSGYNGYGGVSGNLAYLSLSNKTQADQWYTVTGVYTVPDGQNVTRFAFISKNATIPGAGNLLDNLTFSTLIGNLSAVQNSDGSVSLRGYWGETDTSKKLKIKIGDNTLEMSMSTVMNRNFIIAIPKATIGSATQVEVYHQDYEAAKRILNIVFYATAHQDPQNISNYYTTFYHGTCKYELPTGVEAYVGTVNENKLTLTKIAEGGQTIPANTAVILKSTTSSYSLSVSDNEAVSVASNHLRGVDVATTISTSAYKDKVIYTLAAENSTLGFYKYTGSTLAANKAFLALDAAIAGTRGFAFQFEETTSINEELRMKNEEFAPAVYYNLNGQKVQKPTKGLFIKNGKKVIVK